MLMLMPHGTGFTPDNPITCPGDWSPKSKVRRCVLTPAWLPAATVPTDELLHQ